MRLITTRALTQAIRDAHERDRLIATTTLMRGHRPPRYRFVDCCCAIGAALTDDECAGADPDDPRLVGTGIERILPRLGVRFQDLDIAKALQRAHDRACYNPALIVDFWLLVGRIEQASPLREHDRRG